MQQATHLIGWKEYVEFIDWRLRHVKAKIDTGARTSALGVQVTSCVRNRREQKPPRSGSPSTAGIRNVSKEVVTPVVKMVVVSNSSGMREQRPLIETTFRARPGDQARAVDRHQPLLHAFRHDPRP